MKTRGSEAESNKVSWRGKDKKDRKESNGEVKKEASRDKTPVKSKRKSNIIIRNPAAITLSQFEVLNKKQQEKKQNVSANKIKCQLLQKSKEGDSSKSKNKCPNKGSPEGKHQQMFVFKTPQTKKQQNSMIFEVERKQARRYHHLQMCYNVMDQPLTIGPNSIISKQLEKEYQEKSNPQLSGNKEGMKEKGIMDKEYGSQVHNYSLKQEEEDDQHHSITEKNEQLINAKEKKIRKRNKKRNQFEMLLKQSISNKLGAANTRSSVPSVQDKALTRNQLHKKYKFKVQIKKLGRPVKPQVK